MIAEGVQTATEVVIVLEVRAVLNVVEQTFKHLHCILVVDAQWVFAGLDYA